MASDKGDRKGLKEHPLVTRLVPDPGKASGLVVLTGFLGRSVQPGNWRLYVSAALDNYFEFPESDVAHWDSIEPAQNPVAANVVWLTSSANLRLVSTRSTNLQAEFLRGEVEQQFRPSASVSGMATLAPLAALRPAGATARTSICDIITCSLFPTDPCSISRPAWPCV
jgi:hypothetical protein